jgi:hypothetical protein
MNENEENEFNGKIAAGRNNTTENTRIGSKVLLRFCVVDFAL